MYAADITSSGFGLVEPASDLPQSIAVSWEMPAPVEGLEGEPSPKLLAALAACMGMDVASYLGRMEVPLTSLRVLVRSEGAKDKTGHVEALAEFQVTCPDPNPEMAIRAVRRSLGQAAVTQAQNRTGLHVRWRVLYNNHTVCYGDREPGSFDPR